jgi:hypothetical protein
VTPSLRCLLTVAATLWWGAAASGCIGDPPGAELSASQRKMIDRRVVDRAPSDMVRISARFGDRVELVGYRLSPATPTHRAGSKLSVTLVWKVDAPLESGWLQFTHLVDRRGTMVANLDSHGPLRAMRGVTGVPLPPSKWTAGKHILDEVDVTIPIDAPPQTAIAVGFYRGRNRAAATGKSLDAKHQAALIKLQVQGTTAAADPGTSVPSVDVPRLSSGATVTIDGLLDEPVWAAAAMTGPFVSPATGKPAPRGPVQGNAKLLYDDTHLYVAFEVEDRKLRGGFAADATDPHLWTRDTVEIMVDPDGDGDNRDYYEIQINPQNLVFDSQFDRYNKPRGGPKGPFGHQQWSAKLDSAVKLRGSLDDDSDDDQGYCVEARIPWASFDKARRSPPRAGDSWRLNFYAMQNNGGVAWSPILGKGNFHRASRFGRVRWTARQVP